MAVPVADCPRCRTAGRVTGNRKILLQVKCGNCGFKWQTMSAICNKCGKPNGYTAPGICTKCYQAKKRLAEKPVRGRLYSLLA